MPDQGETRLLPVGEGALLVELGVVSPATAARARSLAARAREAALPGVLDLIPAYRSVLVRFDPSITEGTYLAPLLLAMLDGLAGEDRSGRVIELPVLYGGAAGPDLHDVATHTGFSAEEVVRRHADATYRLEFIGFSPGFPYLSGLPSELSTPRLASPRLQVPAGSVAIGGMQTGFYPLPSPGGWRLIGRIPDLRFDPADPTTLPYQPGDTIRFRAIDQATYEALERTAARPVLHNTPDAPDATRRLRVIRAGLQSTIQDNGRPGSAWLGYAEAGALDRTALRLANRLVGNAAGAAGVELTLDGGEFEAESDLLIAIGGADLAPHLDGEPLPIWHAAAMPAGSRLRFDLPHLGLRAYLAIAGGIDMPLIAGSRSTDLIAGIGGYQGRALQAGDVLPIGTPSTSMGYLLPHPPNRKEKDPLAIRIVWGPQDDWFDDATRAAFTAEPFVLSARGDRTGLRLHGRPVLAAFKRDLASEGQVPGAIQVPPDGQPIVLLADGRGIGGYPKIAAVIGADLDRLAQARPGSAVLFRPVTLAEAREATRSWARFPDGLLLQPVPELAVRCLYTSLDVTQPCPRSLICLLSRRCMTLTPADALDPNSATSSVEPFGPQSLSPAAARPDD